MLSEPNLPTLLSAFFEYTFQITPYFWLESELLPEAPVRDAVRHETHLALTSSPAAHPRSRPAVEDSLHRRASTTTFDPTIRSNSSIQGHSIAGGQCK
jgi:hypothetical protein